MTPDIVKALIAARADGKPIVLATRLSDGMQRLITPQDAALPLGGESLEALARDRSRSVERDGETWFLHVHAPAFRLVIIGAVHIAQALAPLAAAMGYAVIVVDPRKSFATAERFPNTALLHDWPDNALDTLLPDERTYIVALTHDPKLDDPALDRALRSKAGYIGALGSRRSHASRLERLRTQGHSEDNLTRIRGPVGLALGAVTAPEIALSIVAELVATRRGSALAQR